MGENEKKVPWYDKIEAAIIIVLMIAMTAILFVNVVTRFGFKYTASWTEQAARIMFVWVTFAGVSLADKTCSHLQVNVVDMIFGKRAKYLYWIGDIITIVFCAYISYMIFQVMMTVLASKQTFAAIKWLPSWILYLPGVLGMLGLVARIIQRNVRALRAAKNKEVQA